MPNMDPITRVRSKTTPVITTDRNIKMPVFVLILARRICLLILSSMQYRLRFFAIFLSMIVANSKISITFVAGLVHLQPAAQAEFRGGQGNPFFVV